MALTALAALLPASSPAQTAASSPLVVKLSIHDTIQPITAEYMKRGLDDAASRHAEAVLISMGTPGGLLDSTREMVADIEASPVPVIIFVEPSGSRAGSAGFFLLESADVAAMAPGTNAGAAHPILEGTTMDAVLKQKIENDAAAFLRSYVTVRGRDAKDAEDAVRNSKSFSEAEALKLHLIDVVAADDNALLAALNGRTIKRFHGESVKLDFTHAQIVPLPPSTRERLLTRLTSPDLDVLLLLCGGLLIYLEFNVPGTIVPGALGTLMMLLAIFGLNLLPVQHTAILLLFAALALMVLEAKFSSHGVLGTVGILCLGLWPRHAGQRPRAGDARPLRRRRGRGRRLRRHYLRPRMDRRQGASGQTPHRPAGDDWPNSRSHDRTLPAEPARAHPIRHE